MGWDGRKHSLEAPREFMNIPQKADTVIVFVSILAGSWLTLSDAIAFLMVRRKGRFVAAAAHEPRNSTRCLDPAVAKEDGPVCPLDYGDVDRPIFSHRQNTLCTRKLLHHVNLEPLRSPVGC